jgi:hypothetical protein
MKVRVGGRGLFEGAYYDPLACSPFDIQMGYIPIADVSGAQPLRSFNDQFMDIVTCIHI